MSSHGEAGQDRTGQDNPKPKPMLVAVHWPPFGNQDQLSLLLIDNRPLNRSSPPGHVFPCGLVEVAFKGRNVREKGLEIKMLTSSIAI